MSTHLVVGAGPIGTRTALQLADAGEQVRIVTRSGGGPDHPAVEKVAADASDAPRMRALADGAVAVYNCANPTYTRWDTDWPPIAAALLDAAGSSGAVLATVGNLYGYGRVTGPITDTTPLAPSDHKGEVRVRMWRDALAAHEAGRVRVVEVRASDYADAGANSHLARNAPAVVGGRTAWVLGGADAPHTLDDHARHCTAAHRRRGGRAGARPGLARAERPTAEPAPGAGGHRCRRRGAGADGARPRSTSSAGGRALLPDGA